MLAFATQKPRPRRHLLEMSLRRKGKLLCLAGAMQHEFLEICHFGDPARTKHRQRFFRKARISFGRVNQLSGRTIREFHLRSHAIGKRQTARRRPGRLRKYTHRLRSKQETKVIEEMARFAEHSSSALGVIRVPMRRIEFPGHDAKCRGLWTGALLQSQLEFGAGWSEAPIEAHLHSAFAPPKRGINSVQFFAREA